MRSCKGGRCGVAVIVLLAFVALSAITVAEEPMNDTSSKETPRLVPYINYGGDIWTRPALTGDWLGSRQQLMEKGVRLDFSLTQVFQHNLSGGLDYRLAHPVRLDFDIQLDTGKMGLWPGAMIYMRGMAGYGTSANGDTGALLPVDTAALYPVPGEDTAALTDLYIVQFLSESFGVMVGKMCPRDTNVFAHDETTQFMNTAFVFNPVMGTTVPLCFLGAGVIWKPVEPLTLTALVLDSEDSADGGGFDTVFHRGTSVYATAELEVNPFGLPGHQRIAGTWSDRSRTQLEQDPRTIIGNVIQGTTPVLAKSSDDWSVMYDFDQYVYLAPGSKERGLGLFGRVGVSGGEVNPVKAFYSIGLGGKGMIPGREKDTFGLGYYYLSTSDKLPKVIKNRIEDEQGVEAYYNIEVTPWLHVTPDLQLIDPVRSSTDMTWVAGLRVKIDF